MTPAARQVKPWDAPCPEPQETAPKEAVTFCKLRNGGGKVQDIGTEDRMYTILQDKVKYTYKGLAV